jgi:hypothetical protein
VDTFLTIVMNCSGNPVGNSQFTYIGYSLVVLPSMSPDVFISHEKMTNSQEAATVPANRKQEDPVGQHPTVVFAHPYLGQSNLAVYR